MNYAFVFPGQGSQYLGMGLMLAKEYSEAAEIFKRADAALGRSLSGLIENGPEADLAVTWNTQPAILTASVACLAALRARVDVSPLAFAGHSLGEYSALVAAGALSFEDAVVLVEKRGRFMQEAVPVGVGSMYAILGLEAEALWKICEEFSVGGQSVSIANDNCPGQLVISGHAEASEKAAAAAKEAGAKRAVKLNVSAPFHCALMKPAADRLAAELSKVVFSKPSAPVVANVDAAANSDEARIPGLLAAQVASGVRWTDSVRTLRGLGVDTLVEIGPGKVLSGFTKRIVPELGMTNVENHESLEAFLGGLGR